MTPHSWKIAGLATLAAAAVLALVSIPMALDAAEAVHPGQEAVVKAVRAIILAVLAGVAFFIGLACLFWSSAVEARHQRAEILHRLAARPPA